MGGGRYISKKMVEVGLDTCAVTHQIWGDGEFEIIKMGGGNILGGGHICDQRPHHYAHSLSVSFFHFP